MCKVTFAPKHGSWLDIAESEPSVLTRQRIRGQRTGDLEELRREAGAWATDVSEHHRGADWQMTVADACCDSSPLTQNRALTKH